MRRDCFNHVDHKLFYEHYVSFYDHYVSFYDFDICDYDDHYVSFLDFDTCDYDYDNYIAIHDYHHAIHYFEDSCSDIL